MAITNLTDAQGYTPVEVAQETVPVVPVQTGSSPVPSTGAGATGFTPDISTPVPGEVLPVQASNLTPQAGGATATVGEGLDALLTGIVGEDKTEAKNPAITPTADPVQGKLENLGREIPLQVLDAPEGSVDVAPPPLPGEDLLNRKPDMYQSVLSPIVKREPDRGVNIPASEIRKFVLPTGEEYTPSLTNQQPPKSTAAKFNPEQSAEQAVQKATTTGNPLDIAKAYMGLDERDTKAASTLSEFFKTAAGLEINPADTAWCAAFANAVLGQAGFGGTGRLNARSFLDYGEPVEEPKVGDIVVFQRGGANSWQGHVGFIAGINKDGTLEVLGGNQSTSDSGGRGVTANIKTYGTDLVLGYRRPTIGG